MWEALTAIGTLASAAVITITVILSVRQVRATVDQLEHVRRSTQFEAAHTVLQEFSDPEFTESYKFVYQDLERCMEDEEFRREVALIGIADPRLHKELYMLRTLDRIGAYVRYGLVERAIVYTTFRWRILLCWEALQGVVDIHRKIGGPDFWENVEYLYDDCKRWCLENGRGVDMQDARRLSAIHAAPGGEE